MLRSLQTVKLAIFFTLRQERRRGAEQRAGKIQLDFVAG
jgi:hypothetical protein